MALTQSESIRWAADEFERLVMESKPRIAVFDCDGTIWGGDAGSGFMNWTLEQGLVSRSTSDWIDTRHRSYVAGQVGEVQICGEMVQMYAGIHEDEMRAAASRYVEEFVRPRVFAEIASLLETLRKTGAVLWAVSSTNKWVIAEGVRPFGIPEERVLAAEVAVDHGILISTLVDVPTGEGKARSLRRVGVPRPDAVFGNSIHDLAMLEMAAHPYPVNPSPALKEAAAKNGWGYFVPKTAEGTATSVGGE